MKHALLQSLFFVGAASTLSAYDPFVFQIESNQSEFSEVQFAHEGSFADLIDSLADRVDMSQPFTMSLDVDGAVVMIKVAQNNGQPPRDYWTPITDQEKRDLGELVRTLANEKQTTLWGKQSHLEGTLKPRLVHLHPLKFLTIIFTDNELKVCMKNLDGKLVVWKKFEGETADSLAKENNAGNITQDQINDFANKVGLSSAELAPYFQGQKWEQLISFLIAKVKVDKPQGKKYNM